jgi:hypothetical protein
MVPSAEVTLLMRSTFLAVVFRQTQDIEETERQLGLVRTRHSPTSRCVEPIGVSCEPHKLRPGVGRRSRNRRYGGTVSRAASRPSSGRPHKERSAKTASMTFTTPMREP